MSFFAKLRGGSERAATAPAHLPSADDVPPGVIRRSSNGLKDFLWLLSDVQQGHILDLGPVSQATVNFFTERGFKIYSDDLLRSWKEFLNGEEERLRGSRPSAPDAETAGGEASPARLAKLFLEASLAFPPATFHAVLLWDVLDYLDEELLPLIVARLFWLLRGGGVVLGIFHSKKPESLHRYRIPDMEHIELVPTVPPLPLLRQLQNRDLMNLFAAYRSSKTFVGRDQLREGLFLK